MISFRGMKHILPVLFPILFIVLFATACAPTLATRGNMVDSDDLATITIGESNKGDVRNVLGSPTTTAPLNDDV